MNGFRIKTLEMWNFKGQPHLKIDFNGRNTSIFGANEAGKTTIADSISYLLADKDTLGQSATGRSSFCIQPQDINGNIIHRLETKVQAVFVKDDGEEVTLCKCLNEKWVKRRGSLEESFDGTVTTYSVDDVDKKATAYNAKVAEISADEKTMRLLSNPLYFLSLLDVKERRKMVIAIGGDVTDQQVIESSEELADLPKILGKKSVEDFVAGAKDRVSKIAKENSDKDAVLKEKKKDLEELKLEVTNPEPIIKKLIVLRESLSAKNKEIVNLENGSGKTELETELSQIIGKMQNLENAHQVKVNAALQGKIDDLARLRDALAYINTEIRGENATKGHLIENIANEKRAKTALVDLFYKVDAEVFKTGCPCVHCGALPENQLLISEENFNLQKSKRLEEIETKGLASKNKIATLSAAVATIDENIVALTEKKTKKQELIDLQAKAIAEKDTGIVSLDKDSTYIALSEMKKSVSVKIDAIQAGSNEPIVKAKEERTAIEQEIQENEKYIAGIESSQKINDRIFEVTEEMRGLAREHEKLLGHLAMVDKFNRKKVSLLEGPINEKFAPVSFKMFHEANNGGLSEVCEAMVGGVHYNSLNSAARIQAGCYCINQLSNYFNFHSPVMIDGRESVTEIPPMGCQIISLVVSPMDKTLRIEEA